MGKRANVAMASGPATPGTVGNSGAETTPEKIAKIKAEPAEQATRERERERGGYHIDTAMRDTQMYVHNNNNDHNNDNNTNTYIYIYVYTCYMLYIYIYIHICIHMYVYACMFTLITICI